LAQHQDKTKNHDDDHGHQHGAGRYVVIWLALLALTVLTVVTGRMELGSANLFVALIIATVKAGLVVLFFMHLWDAEGVMRLVFAGSVLFVVVLLLGVFGDVLTRAPAALPPRGMPAVEAAAAGHAPAPSPDPGRATGSH
jgi:cytochrome c oxidase subunit 4